MHYVKSKGILSPNNTMNIYRGCTHGCIYCDSRSDCYNLNHEFTDIQVKENALELLEQKLISKRNKCMIHTGSMTDPYIQLEDDISYMSKSLELIYKYGFGVTIITKSNLILKDIELLKKINEKTKCVVQISMTTFDENLCKTIEPNVSTTYERYLILKELEKANIPTIVWLCPILPFINDTKENINGILDYCIDAKVYGVLCFNMGVTMREGNREYFYKNLDKYFPNMKQKYIETFGNKYSLESENSKELMQLLKKRCSENNIEHNVSNLFKYRDKFEENNEFEQLSLF